VVGRLTAVNTACAAAGSMLASFVVLPLLGLWNSFALIALVYALLSVFVRGSRGAVEHYALPALSVVLTLSMAVGLAHTRIGFDPRTQVRLGHWESAYGWIDVLKRKDNGQLDLKHNSRYRLSSSKLAHYEVRQGHIPLLLHPDPQRVLYLGLATGVTSSSALYHPEVRSAEIVELIPEVLEAARLFSEVNRGVVDADKTRVHINDARHHLHADAGAHDVIVSDLFIPWESKTGYLYTVEHYHAARAHLKPGGLFCQWIHLWEVGARELELIADSLAAVFPRVTLFKADVRSNVPVLGLVGSEEPLRVDGVQLAARLARMDPPANGRPKALNAPEDLYALFIGRWRARKPDFLNTDEHPRVEFLAPITHNRARLLKRGRLERYYRDVLMGLPLSGLEVTSRPGASPLDLGAGRAAQLADFERRRKKRLGNKRKR
ncbi:MAG: hypothetical protein OXT09_25905, partial [Myxococcales bacterium]|nr:hypothetical protein [Myxococcales bacterium]